MSWPVPGRSYDKLFMYVCMYERKYGWKYVYTSTEMHILLSMYVWYVCMYVYKY